MRLEKRKIRILHYIVATHLGGAERSLLDLVKMQKISDEFYPIVVVPLDAGPLIEKMREANVEVHVVPMPARMLSISRSKPFTALLSGITSVFSGISYFVDLRRKCKHLNADLVYTTGLKCHLIGTALATTLRKPIVWHLRDILSLKMSNVFRLFFTLGRVHIIANSKASMNSVNFYGLGPRIQSRLTVIPNGLDATVYCPKRHNDLKVEVGCPVDTILIGIVGVIAEWKGQKDFIEVACHLLRKGKRVYFAVIGDEIYDTGNNDQGFRKRLEDFVSKLGFSDRIRFVGYKNDSAWVMNGLDILVHASRKPEPFGRVIIEAMSCGTAVVASKEGGILEIIQDQKTGLLFVPRSQESMEEKISQLIDHKETRLNLVDVALSDFKDKFTLNSHFRQVSNFIKDHVLSS